MQTFLNLLSGSLILVAFFLAQLSGIVVVPFGLPGPLFQAAAAVALCVATHGARMPWYWAAGFFGVGVVAEIADLLAGQFGSKKFGGSKRAAWGALIGGFVGAFGGSLIPVPVMGSVVASFIGTFVGAMLGEMRHQEELSPNLRVGMGAVLGRAAGIAVKLFIAFVLFIASVAIVAFS